MSRCQLPAAAPEGGRDPAPSAGQGDGTCTAAATSTLRDSLVNIPAWARKPVLCVPINILPIRISWQGREWL